MGVDYYVDIHIEVDGGLSVTEGHRIAHLVKDNLQKAPVIHSDETGFYYESKRNWLHVAATEDFTYYFPHEKRGKDAIDEMGILPGYAGIVMHDYWKSYLDYDCTHSLCSIHRLRDLTFCHEQEMKAIAVINLSFYRQKTFES